MVEVSGRDKVRVGLGRVGRGEVMDFFVVVVFMQLHSCLDCAISVRIE